MLIASDFKQIGTGKKTNKLAGYELAFQNEHFDRPHSTNQQVLYSNKGGCLQGSS